METLRNTLWRRPSGRIFSVLFFCDFEKNLVLFLLENMESHQYYHKLKLYNLQESIFCL